jgi:hypothetical protein
VCLKLNGPRPPGEHARLQGEPPRLLDEHTRLQGEPPRFQGEPQCLQVSFHVSMKGSMVSMATSEHAKL